jgi:hypothetical protein
MMLNFATSMTPNFLATLFVDVVVYLILVLAKLSINQIGHGFVLWPKV